MERLKKAFQLMRKRGLLARMNFSCCQSCGGYELGTMLADDKNKKKIGYAFYHHQDNDDLQSSGYTHIAYAAKSDEEGECKKVGDIVNECLKEAGVVVEWSGSIDQRIRAVLKG